MTATNTALAAGVRTPLALIGIGALAMAAVETLNPQYELVSETLSRYVHGTAGWLVPAALLAVGTASAILAVRLGAGTRRAGRAALAMWAAGILVAGFFPADPPGNWSRPSLPELVHGNAAFLAFAALPTASMLLRGTLVARRPRVRTALNTLTVATATVVLAVFPTDVMSGGPSLRLGGAPTLVALAGRLVLAVDFGWIALALVVTGTSPERGQNRRG
ncbi:hypothetical protein EES37_34475 [Streptomyces sp. ADI91-18]|uniref:DUF998 domain-containing protein n=1 Tax=Streptomyces sp. ADI91-18 TaxID=1522755 RepID=UPI000F54DBF1|nr:DUF998 domain-containing protein [Streptomyces sp. ADI91-18]RPK31902.1 hypothetical protein EES37_34475 [Streptomyces sp. ADI91-18]